MVRDLIIELCLLAETVLIGREISAFNDHTNNNNSEERQVIFDDNGMGVSFPWTVRFIDSIYSIVFGIQYKNFRSSGSALGERPAVPQFSVLITPAVVECQR